MPWRRGVVAQDQPDTCRAGPPASSRILLLRGGDKRMVFEQALDGTDPRKMPIRIAFTTPGATLDVYWCA